MKEFLSVREMQLEDVALIADYWLNSDRAFLQGMGVDLRKMPSGDHLTTMLTSQLQLPYEQKRSYCIIWEIDGKAAGHCNTNPTHYGDHAFMHLHLWDGAIRNKGIGEQLVRMTLPYFFNNLQLEYLYCEPYALNPAPNKTLEKIGFLLEKEYVTIPGSLNFEQPVKRWILSYDQYRGIINRNGNQ